MDIMLALQEVNYLAVIVAAIVYFALGALWYSTILFSKEWKEDVGLSDADLKRGNMVRTFAISFLMYFIMSLALAVILGPAATLKEAVNLALVLGIGLVAASMASNIIYEQRPLRLFLINSSYGVIGLLLAAVIIGSWS